MSNAASNAALEYEAETSAALWGEDVTTFGTHLSVLGEPDVSGLYWNKEPAGRMEEYRGGGQAPVLMMMGGTFKTKHDIVRGTTMVGAPSLSPFGTIWGIAVGTNVLSLTTSQTTSGGTAAVLTMSGATGISAGGLVRVGSLGDAKGNGQFYAVATHAASSATLIGSLDGAPTAGNVVYPVEQIHGYSSPTATDIVGARFRFLSGNLGYEAHGCFATGYEATGINVGERPQVTITWEVSWWRYTATALPSANAAVHYNPSPVAAGSFNFQSNTTTPTTRQKYAIRSLSITHTLNVVPMPNLGNVNAYQKWGGAKRGGPDTIAMSFVVDADTTTATPVWHARAIGIDTFHVEGTLSTTDGSALGFKMPKVCITNVPVQMNDGGINRLKIDCAAYAGATVTSELTRAPIVWGLA